MKIPPKGETETYDLSDTEYAAVQQEESGQFWVTIVNRGDLEEGVEVKGIFDNNSNIMFINTDEELKGYLLEKADEAHKSQFGE
jgi:hypothetical protein